MPDVSVEAAVERAREALSLGSGLPARAGHVARLDRPGTGYYLVWFGTENATIAVAAVDAVHGEVLAHAGLPGSAPHLAVTGEDALRQAGVTGIAAARLVWCPCRASFSMLSPFWEVTTARGPVYVDQQGHLWTELDPGGPGG